MRPARLSVLLTTAVLAAAGLSVAVSAPAQAVSKTFTVNLAGNSAGTAGDGVCDVDSGTAGDQCTLREAIMESNANPDTDTIAFDTAGFATPYLISVSSVGLPDITNQVVIDGTTQPGYNPATGAVVRVDGGNFGLNGLKPSATADGTVIKGLFLSRWNNAVLIAGDSNTVAGNFFGVPPSGAVVTGFQNSTGVNVSGGSNNLIGGTTIADRNVIGRNGTGIQISGNDPSSHPVPGNADGNQVLGNYVGLRQDGSTIVANSSTGVSLVRSMNTVVGNATGPNLISGNGGAGVEIQDSLATTIGNNLVGTDAGGTLDKGNGQGIRIYETTGLTVSQNVISGNSNGIYSTGANDFETTITGNLIGTNASGTAALPNSAGGIVLTSNELGEVSIQGNTVSGNTGSGIVLDSVATASIRGNRVGTDLSGNVDVGNTVDGIQLCDVHDAVIGGTTPSDANVISGNNSDGIELTCGSTETTIEGNIIGRGANRSTLVNNTNHGINVSDGQRNDIGGIAPGAANLIANNGQDGVNIAGPSGSNVVRGNSITANGNLGIDLYVNGVTLNDVGDADAKANARQNFPVLTEAGSDGGSTAIEGSLSSRPDRDYRIDFYKSPACDGLGYGEGETYLGSKVVTTDGTGNVGFTAALPAAVVGAGEQVTATATDLYRQDTSEFSLCRTAIGLPTASIDDVTVTEGSGGSANATFTVTLSAPPTVAASLRATTADGTATSLSDFTAVDTVVNFVPGDTSETVTVPLTTDVLDEDDETFTVSLSQPDSLTISDASGTGTITDDDNPPTLSISDVSINEPTSGTANATLSVSLSAPSSKLITVKYATASGTANATDYAPRALTTLTFYPGGITTRTINVPIKSDLRDEPDQTVLVNLSAPTNSSVADGQGVVTIVDTDDTPGVSITDVTAAEGNGTSKTFSFTVTLTNPSDSTVTVQYATADGSASAPSDYNAKAGTLSFAPGIVSKPLTVSVKGGTISEADETFLVQLSNAGNANLVDALGTGTIVNDDGP